MLCVWAFACQAYASDDDTGVRPDSPRGALHAFSRLCQQGHFSAAAFYLDHPSPSSKQAVQTVRRLKAVLDHKGWVDLEAISNQPQGVLNDGLPESIEEITRVRGPGGMLEPIRMFRRTGGDREGWFFTTRTLERVPVLYQELPGRWWLERIPPMFLREGPYGLFWWQWMALPLFVLCAGLTGWVLGYVLRRMLARATAHTEITWDDVVVQRIGTPLMAACTVWMLHLNLPLMSLMPEPQAMAKHLLRVVFFVVLFWSALRVMDVFGQVLQNSFTANHQTSLSSLVPLFTRIGKVLVVVAAGICVLSELGYPVTSLVAGLGIGGLAFALAAQKTVENLFGAFSLGVDQPFREGDFVKVDDVQGTVERVGLRSTLIRTQERTLVSMPNGKLADMRIENFTLRDRMRMHVQLPLVQHTSAENMRLLMQNIENHLRQHPKTWQETVLVRFVGIAEYSLTLEISAWFLTGDTEEFTYIRQHMLLDIMGIVRAHGSDFALPTRLWVSAEQKMGG